ncbi:hypothetical protein EV122DRAFT_200418 [Schizophyllum commune]
MASQPRKPPSKTRRKLRSPAQRAALEECHRERRASKTLALGTDDENSNPSGRPSARHAAAPARCSHRAPLSDLQRVRVLDNMRHTARRRDHTIAKQVLEIQRLNAEHKEELERLEIAHEQEILAAGRRIVALQNDLAAVKEEVARLHRIMSEQQETIENMQGKLQYKQRLLDRLQKRARRNSPQNRRHQQQLARESAVQHMLARRVYDKGAYTEQARVLIRELIRAGCSEKKAGSLIVEFGRLLGVRELARLHIPSARSTQRFVAEGGVAADVQTGLMVALNKGKFATLKVLAPKLTGCQEITSSSDSTSFRHQNLESRFLALKPINEDGELSDEAVLHALGVGATVDHSSEASLADYLACLTHKFDVFNRSPIAKRRGLFASLQNFALAYQGTNGDHANDVRKDNKDLRQFKMNMTIAYLGTEHLKTLSPEDLILEVIPFARAAVQDVGGSEAWTRLDGEERASGNLAMMEALARSAGRKILDEMSAKKRQELTRWLWAGCCMHKELNSVKGGDDAMRAYYEQHVNVPRPVLLANKDNAAILRHASRGDKLTDAELRALAVSGSGAVKATTLGGMICNNKNSKKGQHDTYVWFFQTKLGLRHSHVFPDVSNTRFQSHCDAACEIILHLPIYRIFMQCVFWRKNQPGFTNVEQNFYNALYDMPTLTEMCVLVLYANCVTYPYARHIRGPGTDHLNALDLGDYHNGVKAFVRSLIVDPGRVLDPGTDHISATLDGQEMHQPRAFAAVISMQDHLPYLRTLFVVFLEGALTVWERFTSEYIEGGAIDLLSDEEREKIFLPATNDANESALGTAVASKRLRPNETLHQFDARYTYERNDTREFMENCFEEEDYRFVHGEARALLASLPQAHIRRAQVEHDNRVAAEHRRAAEEQAAAKAARQAELEQVSLVLDAEALEGMTVPSLKEQLDIWRHVKKAPHVPEEKELRRRKAFRVAALKQLFKQYPDGDVPEAEHAQDAEEQEGEMKKKPRPLYTGLAFKGPQVTAGSVADGVVDTFDALYDSDDEDC